MVINIFIGNQYLEMANGLVGLLFFCSCTQKSRPHYRKQLCSDRNHSGRGGASGIGDSAIAIDGYPLFFFIFAFQAKCNYWKKYVMQSLFPNMCANFKNRKIHASVLGPVIQKTRKNMCYFYSLGKIWKFICKDKPVFICIFSEEKAQIE
jgi:hypothetical protein